jgi:hypothetical protein
MAAAALPGALISMIWTQASVADVREWAAWTEGDRPALVLDAYRASESAFQHMLIVS